MRAIVPADRPVWAALRQRLWPECTGPRNAAEMAAYLAEPARYGLFLASDSEGAAVGVVEVSLRPNYRAGAHPPIGFLEGLYVVPGHRRRGVGRALVRAAEAWARSHGCREMGSDTAPSNGPSRRAHRAYGYREVERLVVFGKRLR